VPHDDLSPAMAPRIIEERPGCAEGTEVVLVLGGDGTLLRAAEMARPVGVPLLGVNLGRVGFLAETEEESLDEALDAIVEGRYAVEERMTLDAVARSNGDVLARTWALNEATVEKSTRERILEVVLEVDGRPVSAFGCDGVLCATPTGSTAYAFSAGGPLVWPQVEALLLIPSNAHALFARPMVISPDSQVAIEVDPSGPPALLDCDGRRTFPLPPGARVELARGGTPVLMVRLDGRPFADRLVRKFDLPVRGWRGASRTSG
jgi:NAD+ kinase